MCQDNSAYNKSFTFQDFILEPIHEKHAWRLCDFVTINQERLKRFFWQTMQANLTPDLSQLFVKKKERDFQLKEEFLFVLKNITSRKIKGIFYIKDLYWKNKSAELAYCIEAKLEGLGITTQAVKLLSKHAFENLDLEHLKIIVHKSNLGSIRVAEKNGFVWNKTLEKAWTPLGEDALDMEYYQLNIK